MQNHIRTILLVLIVAILGVGGAQLFKNYIGKNDLVTLTALKSGIDIEIENFVAVNENSEEKIWELKADLAQIDQENNLTHLQNVELTMKNKENQDFWVVADSGVLKNETNDVELEGNVRMIGSSEFAKQRLAGDKDETTDQKNG